MPLSMGKQSTEAKSSVKFRIKINQYGSHLDVYFCDSIYETAKKLIPEGLSKEDAESTAAFFFTRNHPSPKKRGVLEFIMLLDLHHVCVNDVAHETVHFASFLYDHVGVLHDPDNDEPFAYLIGYVVGQICFKAFSKGINIAMK